MTDLWRVDRPAAGVGLVRCRAIESVPGLAHAFTIRGTDAARALAASGLAGATIHAPRQVHGATVAAVSEMGGDPPAADAVVADRSGDRARVPCVRTADCVPVLLAARDGSRVAAVHSGWRGTAADVAGETVRALARRGSAPPALVAAVGPAIGPCCYPVGAEVLRAVARAAGLPAAAVRRGRDRLDLREAVAAQLRRAGLPPGAIHVAPWCTRCSVEPPLDSYRRDGTAAGRSVALIGWPGDGRA